MLSKKVMATERVLAAWTVEGFSPIFHRAQKDKLRRNWPTLYLALVALEQADKEED